MDLSNRQARRSKAMEHELRGNNVNGEKTAVYFFCFRNVIRQNRAVGRITLAVQPLAI
jgi:hypothetical protein